MSYLELRGNLFNSKAEAIVNTVNCHGVMGKGIALEFRRRYPAMFLEYTMACKQGEVLPGKIWSYKECDKWILNFAVKDHWRYPAKFFWVENTLKEFRILYKAIGIQSVAFPLMGAANGGLPLDEVQALMKKYLEPLPDLDVEVYEFDPHAPDPVFFSLKELIIDCKDEQLSNIKIPREKKEKLCQYIVNGKIKSMAAIEDYRLLGPSSMDKLYALLAEMMQKRKEDNPQKRKEEQLALFS